MERRTLLALALGFIGVGSVYRTGAFDSIENFRPTRLRSALDGTAYLGLSLPEIATPGIPGNELVTVTNNTNEPLTVSVGITNNLGGESIQPTQTTLQASHAEQFTGDVAVDRVTTGNPVELTVVGAGDRPTIEVSRSVPVPTLAWTIFDNTLHGNTQFDIQYAVGDVPTFDEIVVTVEDITESWGLSETFSSNNTSGVFSTEAAGGTEGHEHEITFEVYDANLGLVIDKQLTVISDGEDDGEGEVGDDDDPQIEWVYVLDRSDVGTDLGAFTVFYEVSNVETFEEVEVQFDTQQGWARQTTTTQQQPIGSVEYEEGGTAGFDFDITVSARNENGVLVDSATVATTADGVNPDNPDITLSDSPYLTSYNVEDLSSGGQAQYEVTYAIGNTARFDHVEVWFENLDREWSSEKVSSTATSDTITYGPVWVAGDEFNIQAIVYEEREGVVLPVDNESVIDVADGNDP